MNLVFLLVILIFGGSTIPGLCDESLISKPNYREEIPPELIGDDEIYAVKHKESSTKGFPFYIVKSVKTVYEDPGGPKSNPFIILEFKAVFDAVNCLKHRPHEFFVSKKLITSGNNTVLEVFLEGTFADHHLAALDGNICMPVDDATPVKFRIKQYDFPFIENDSSTFVFKDRYGATVKSVAVAFSKGKWKVDVK